MEQMLEEARALVAEARQQIPSYPSADQVITVKTAKGNVYSFPYHLVGGHEEVEDFLRKLLENDDTVVRFVVCVWEDGNIEVPSDYLQEHLMLLNVKNAGTAVFLAAEPGLMYKTLALMRLR